MISTIILNWNRCDLLRKTIESYLATTRLLGVELFIVDNASTDKSRDYLRNLEREIAVSVFYLDRNIGGAAYNQIVPLTKGTLIHLCENDQEFLPRWVEHVQDSFNIFADLGQLSLFHNVPTDSEAADLRPAQLRFRNGKILYEAQKNVTTSSIIRSDLFHKHHIRVANIEHGAFIFPNDGQLSADIKASGYWVAWSDQYYVRNLGHQIEEFERDKEYYEQNYASKPWLGIEGWQTRIARQRALPPVQRKSVALPDARVLPEKTPHPVGDKPARLWSMLDGYTAEVEVLDFLYALVRLVKPKVLLQTGTWLGWSACAIGAALRDNGFGRLTTLEISPDAHAEAVKNIHAYGVENFVNPLLQSSMEHVPDSAIEFAIFDSELDLRESEFRRFRQSLAEGAIVAFHDTAPHFQIVGDAIKSLSSEGTLIGLDFPTPRGIFIGRHFSIQTKK